jgi:hypothetical protein
LIGTVAVDGGVSIGVSYFPDFVSRQLIARMVSFWEHSENGTYRLADQAHLNYLAVNFFAPISTHDSSFNWFMDFNTLVVSYE